MEDNLFTPAQVIMHRKRKFLSRKSWMALIASLVGTFIVTYVLFGTMWGLSSVNGNSMNLSLKNTDCVLYWRLGTYSTGDVVILHREETDAENEDEDNVYVKRIVGKPGDTVDLDGFGNVLINGAVQNEKYAVGGTRKTGRMNFPLILKDDEYFVLGDNREDSKDSRSYGAIRKDQIKGRIVTILRYNKNEI